MVSQWEGASKTADHGIKADKQTDVNYILYLEISKI